MTDGFVGINPDSTGKKVDTTEVTRQDTAVLVERQRVEARDDDDNVLSTAAIIDRLDLMLDEIVGLRIELNQRFEMMLTIMKG